MIIGIPTETYQDDRRVSLIPSSVPDLIKAGTEVLIEKDSGKKAGYNDSEYLESGAEIEEDRTKIFKEADVILRVNALNFDDNGSELKLFHSGQTVIAFFHPFKYPGLIPEIAKKNITSFAFEFLPRITRAQNMDALTSMATIVGYKAAIIACSSLDKMFPMMITPAGTISPAHVLVIGAGVAGLQAIATCRRLGAVVKAYDVRPDVKDQVISVGGTFVELKLETAHTETSGGYAKFMGEEFYKSQQQLMSEIVAESDVVITTASVVGKKAPVLITKDMVERMKPGSVIVDLAADSGGNCELTSTGGTVVVNSVKIIGDINLPSTIPYHSSQMYSNNISAFLLNIIKDGQLVIDMEDEIVKDTLITRDGQVTNNLVKELLNQQSK